MKDAQRISDGILKSNTDRQVSDQAVRVGTRKAGEHSAQAAANPMDALRALVQTMKLASTGPKTEMRPVSIDGD